MGPTLGCNQHGHAPGCAHVTGEALDVALEPAGASGAAAQPAVLSAPPSTNPASEPFGRAATLKDLDHHFEALTSPENISWDGERAPGAAQAEYARLAAAYWLRRREIDPADSRAYCMACDAEVAFNGHDGPAPHLTDLGRNCWGGR